MDRDPFHFDYASIEAQIAHARAERAAILGDMIGRGVAHAVLAARELALRAAKSVRVWQAPAPAASLPAALPPR